MFDIMDNKCNYRAMPSSEDGVFLYMSYLSSKNEVSDIPRCPSFPATNDILETSARNLETPYVQTSRCSCTRVGIKFCALRLSNTRSNACFRTSNDALLPAHDDAQFPNVKSIRDERKALFSSIIHQ